VTEPDARQCCELAAGKTLVLTTSGMDAEPVRYCATHLPGNLRA